MPKSISDKAKRPLQEPRIAFASRHADSVEVIEQGDGKLARSIEQVFELDAFESTLLLDEFHELGSRKLDRFLVKNDAAVNVYQSFVFTKRFEKLLDFRPWNSQFLGDLFRTGRVKPTLTKQLLDRFRVLSIFALKHGSMVWQCPSSFAFLEAQRRSQTGENPVENRSIDIRELSQLIKFNSQTRRGITMKSLHEIQNDPAQLNLDIAVDIQGRRQGEQRFCLNQFLENGQARHPVSSSSERPGPRHWRLAFPLALRRIR